MFKKILILLFFPSVILFASTWTQTTDSDFATGEFTNAETSGSGSNSNLKLKTATSSNFGCSLRVEGNSNFSLNVSTYKYSIRFTAKYSQTISNIHLCVYKGAAGANPPAYDIGICDNSSGDPSATYRESGNAKGTLDLAAGDAYGWKSIALGATTDLVAGTIYHIVVTPVGAPSGNDYIGIYGIIPPMGISSFDETEDNNLAQLQSINSGTTWTDRTAQPMFIVQGANSEGCTYYTLNNGQQIYANRYFGEKITVTGSSKIVKGVSFRVRANSVAPPPNDHLYVTLQNVTDGVDVETIKLVDKNDITSTFEWYWADFSAPVTLAIGKVYRVYLKSPNSINTRYYLPYRVEGYNPTYAAADNLTYDGTNSLYTENTGAGWVENVNRYDMLFRFSSATYEASGTFISQVFDASSSAFFDKISWLPLTQPSNTSLSIQLASSNSESGPFSFYGPDGTANSYYTNASGETVNSQHTGKRYLKYKVFMSSSNSGTTSYLSSISVTYTARQMPGTSLQTVAYPNPFSPSKGSISVNYILTTNSEVTIKVYTVLGDLVRTFNYSAGSEGGKGDSSGYNNKIEWDGKNGDGMTVGNGVYIMQITADASNGSGKSTEIKKIMVVK